MNETLSGGSTGTEYTYTGSLGTGKVYSPYALGSSSGISGTGITTATGVTWVEYSAATQTDYLHLYGLSQVLTVPFTVSVPEPSTLQVSFFVTSIGLVAAWIRKRKQPGGQGPAGPSCLGQ